MVFEIIYSKQFLKDIKSLYKNNSYKIKQVNNTINIIKNNPFSKSLHIKKLKGEKNAYRYKVSRDLRILVEINEDIIIFQKIRKRENLY